VNSLCEYEIGGKYIKTCRKLFINGCLTFFGVADWFLFGLFVAPTYFGVRAFFFDLTLLRLFEVLLLIMILRNKRRAKDLWGVVTRCRYWPWMALFFAIVFATNLYRLSVNTIMYWLTDALLPFILCSYLILYEYGIERFLNKIKRFVLIVTVISPLQLIIKYPPFLVLNTLNKELRLKERYGYQRLMGNCTVSNGYGLALLLLLPLCCYDPYTKKIDIAKNRRLIILICFNAIMTGTRLAFGALFLTFLLLFLAMDKKSQQRFILRFALLIPAAYLVCVFISNASFMQSLLSSFFSVVDAVFHTSFSGAYGADTIQLYNSARYRELLSQNTIFSDWLNPLIGRGGSYRLHMYVEGYDIKSVDNYYVGLYIAYALPGLISWLCMFIRLWVAAIGRFFTKRDALCVVLAVSIGVYCLSLWYLDQLQTVKIVMVVFALIAASEQLGGDTIKNVPRYHNGQILKLPHQPIG